MPGTVVGKSMNQGFLGSFARNADCIINNRFVTYNTSWADSGPNFGDPVCLQSGGTYNNTVQSVADFVNSARNNGTFSMSVFLGIAVREVKTLAQYPPTTSIVAYAPGQPCDVLERGSVSVKCCVGTPVAGGAVYVRVTANSGVAGSVVGGFEYRADTDSSKCVLLTNAYWSTGNMDGNNVAELTITSRNLP